MPGFDHVPSGGVLLGRAFAAGWPHPALVTVRDDAAFVDALRLMRDHKIRRLPVVDVGGILVGIVTVNDIISLLSTELQLATVAIAEQPLREGRLRR